MASGSNDFTKNPKGPAAGSPPPDYTKDQGGRGKPSMPGPDPASVPPGGRMPFVKPAFGEGKTPASPPYKNLKG